jgi:hypothetical protein
MNQSQCKKRRSFSCIRYDYYIIFTLLAHNHTKLRPYCTNAIDTPARPQAPTRRDAMWADDILGLGTNNPLAYQRSIAAEVDAYLLDSQVSTSCLNFWQVSLHAHHLRFNLILVIGKSTSVSYHFHPCNGRSSHSRLCSPMREGLLFGQGDNYCTT